MREQDSIGITYHNKKTLIHTFSFFSLGHIEPSQLIVMDYTFLKKTEVLKQIPIH